MKKKVYLSFKDNIWGADLADRQLISKFIKGFRFLLCAIGIYSKYGWVVPLKDKKGIKTTSVFQKVLDKSNRKPNKIWVDKGSEFYNKSMKSWLQDNDIEIHLTHNERKSVLAERFIRTFTNKIYKSMTSVSINLYIDKLDDIVNKYKNKYHRTIKMNTVDVKSSKYIYFGIKNNDKDPKFKVGDHVNITKYKNIFEKGYPLNWSEEAFVIKKVENTVPWTYVISDRNGGEIFKMFCKPKNSKKQIKQSLELKK